MACISITGYAPKNKPLKHKFNGNRLSNMCYFNKKIDVLE